jgi:hypothetical protein
MRVGFADLTLWSFVMASAHGAGLMLVPILWQWPTGSSSHMHLIHKLSPEAIARSPGLMLLAVGVHTAGMLLVTTAVAVLVYEKFGLAWLRRAWLNVDVLWTIALSMAGVLALVW